jgi:diadenosine tetraphosphatase ApaH/serine/threonine PP2A family protein phosphatase
MLALLYDVHGNLPALEAVLEDAGLVDGYVIGGDVALFGAWPEATVARLRELRGALWLRGNGERWTATPEDAPGDDVVRARSPPAGPPRRQDRRRAGRAARELELDDGTCCWHGSPVSDVRSFLPEPGPDEDELLAGVTTHRLIFGHTHLPFRRRSRGVELLNPGRSGCRSDGDHRASYAVVDEHGAIDLRRVAYDHEASAAAGRGDRRRVDGDGRRLGCAPPPS